MFMYSSYVYNLRTHSDTDVISGININTEIGRTTGPKVRNKQVT